MSVSFKQARSIGLLFMVLVTVFVGLIPTFSMLKLKGPFHRITEQIQWMDALGEVSDHFNEGKRLYDLYLIGEIKDIDPPFSKILATIDGAKNLQQQVHDEKTSILLEQFIKDLNKFRVSLIFSQKAFEEDPTADTAFLMEKNTITYGTLAQKSLSKLTAGMREILSLEYGKISSILSKSQVVALVGLFIGIIISILVAAVLSRALGWPLKALAAASKKIARGDMDVSLDMQNNTDFQRVADAFNKMAGDLRRYIDQLNQATREANEMAKKAFAASKAKSEFLANMSHEIRTPMNGVIAAADIALAEDLSPEAEKYIRIIQDSGHSLLKIINDILDFSKIESGHLEMANDEFDLEDAVQNVIEMFSNTSMNQGVNVSFRKEPGLPEQVVGDSVRLQQVISNIVNNGIKFTDPGGEIIVTAGLNQLDTQGNRVIVDFFVKDTGSGMKKEQMEKIFDPFMQADTSATRVHGGTGLGLSISKKIIEEMKGQIQIQSEYGKGTMVYFTCCFGLEMEKKKEPLPSPKTNPHKIAQYKEEIKGVKILVAEDNPVNQQIIRKILGKANLDVEITNNGRDAVSALKKARFDAVLMDIQMPVMDGYEATACIRKDSSNKAIPIIALTANAMKGDKEKCLSAGMNGFIPKPIDQEKLFKTLWEAVK